MKAETGAGQLSSPSVLVPLFACGNPAGSRVDWSTLCPEPSAALAVPIPLAAAILAGSICVVLFDISLSAGVAVDCH